MKPKAAPSPAMGLGATLAALAVAALILTSCEDQERFRGRTTEQVKQACDPQRQTPEECSRTLDR